MQVYCEVDMTVLRRNATRALVCDTTCTPL